MEERAQNQVGVDQTRNSVVYENRMVITAQPHGDRLRDNPIQNRLYPISSLDLRSSAFLGPRVLADVEQLEVQRVVDLSTLRGTTEKSNQYRIRLPRAETIFLAAESRIEDQRESFGCFRTFDLNVIDRSGEIAFTIKNLPNRRYLPCVLHKIRMESNNLLGSVEQNFTLIGHSFTVYDESRKSLCNIQGPNICGCCMYGESQFQVISSDRSHQIASLTHQWDNTLLDYTLSITFPVQTDSKLKCLLLGAAFLIEYLFFQRMKPVVQNRM